MTNQPTHNPGPWHYSRYNRLWFGISPDRNPSTVICSIFHENEPDARLIAAAPELLAAAQEVLSWTTQDAWGFAELRAAVAKATGVEA